ncbi:DUF4012 domain-containing protein [Patescibacteria group bacterium]
MSEDLKKIQLDTEEKLQVKPSNRKKTVAYVLLGIFGLVVISIFTLIMMLMPVRSVASQAQEVMSSVQKLSEAAKNQDLEMAKSQLSEVRGKMKNLDSEYKKLDKLMWVPVISTYIKDGKHAINAGFAGLDAGDLAIEALEPNADILGLKGGSKFVMGSAEERIQTAVKTMKALTPKVNEMAEKVDIIAKEVEVIDETRYPENFRGIEVRKKLISLKELVDSTASLFVNAQPLIENLPMILGEPDERRYLVLFQNDKELRATGGFITAYAQFRIVRGKIILEKSDDIYSLDAALSKSFAAPREILEFHKGVYKFNIRDSNISPDFKLSMEQFVKMYETASGREEIDGIIALDTHVLVEALKILGPMYVYDREFSDQIDERCDCPRAVYELEDYSTRPVGYIREARKDIIGVLMRELMYKALGVSPSQYWGRLFQMMLDEINTKHILAYFFSPAEQDAVESFNMAGRIMAKDETAALLSYKEGSGWDYLHINNSNMAGAKSNMFVSQKVTKETDINGDGTVSTKLTIDYKNPYPGSDCGLESGGLCLNAPLRNWIRVYTPLGSKLVSSKGAQSPKDNKPVDLETYDSLNKTVFEGFLIVNPLQTAKLELTYESPVDVSKDYNLLVQKQPGTENQEYTLILNGKEKSKEVLVSDKEFTFK